MMPGPDTEKTVGDGRLCGECLTPVNDDGWCTCAEETFGPLNLNDEEVQIVPGTKSRPECAAPIDNRGLHVEATLSERGKRYGDFDGHARVTQNIKRAMVDSKRWDDLSDDKKESLEMIAHKIGRILNGDPEYADSWHDIAGYARLVEQNLNGEK